MYVASYPGLLTPAFVTAVLQAKNAGVRRPGFTVLQATNAGVRRPGFTVLQATNAGVRRPGFTVLQATNAGVRRPGFIVLQATNAGVRRPGFDLGTGSSNPLNIVSPYYYGSTSLMQELIHSKPQFNKQYNASYMNIAIVLGRWYEWPLLLHPLKTTFDKQYNASCMDILLKHFKDLCKLLYIIS